MIVADTNLIAYLLIPGDASKEAEKVLRSDPEWAAPVLWRSELRGVLAVYLRRRMMSLDEALEVTEKAEALLEGRVYEVPSYLVLALASASSCSAHDCEFVALAQQLDVRLVTSDGALLQAFPRIAVAPRIYTSF